jgi:hypothetical protein
MSSDECFRYSSCHRSNMKNVGGGEGIGTPIKRNIIFLICEEVLPNI